MCNIGVLVYMTSQVHVIAIGPHSIHQYSNMDPRLLAQNCNFLKFHLSHNSQKRLGNKENTKFTTGLS